MIEIDLFSNETCLSLLYSDLLIAVRCQTTYHLSSYRYQILPMSRLSSVVRLLHRSTVRINRVSSFSFKCANSLTVHRRRLHLLPFADSTHPDESETPSTSEDPEVNRGTMGKKNENAHSLSFRHAGNTLVICVNDDSFEERN